MNCLVLKAVQEPFHHHGNDKEFITKQLGPVSFDTNLLLYVTSRSARGILERKFAVYLQKMFLYFSTTSEFLRRNQIRYLTSSLLGLGLRLSYESKIKHIFNHKIGVQ